MYFLSWIIVALVAGWSVWKDSQRQRIRSRDGHCHGHLRSGGGGASHAIRRLWGFSGGHLYDSCCRDWRGPGDVARGFHERQKDVRAATLSVT